MKNYFKFVVAPTSQVIRQTILRLYRRKIAAKADLFMLTSMKGANRDLFEVTAKSEAYEEAITVRTYKYNGTEHRHWHAQLTRQENSLLILNAKFEEEIQHPLLGIIARGTLSIEFYWLDRWYNIFRFHQPSGELRNFYCNINVPPVFHRNVLSYIDLDIDILVAPDLSYSILDEDEFTTNAARFKYPLEVQYRSQQALEQLITLIESRHFPFNNLT